MIPNELRAMVWKLSLPDKLQLSQDLLSYISQDTSNTIDELAQRKAEIKTILKVTNDEIVKNIFREDE